MMQITEDTPPDMLAGAMDLMVHLPDGKTTKMAVERSTPMMDVLVQITNANHLQISGYILQPLAIHSPPGYGEKVLPYFPNTPIGTLDTQDIRVVAKNRGGTALQRGGVPAQPFESTFRLKVHLPRNQLYVERVSMQAHLHEIMKKMCEEKNLDRNKYEFRHPSNLDQVLDLKLRLNDYQITEVYAVNKGSNRLSQVFSSSDSIMAFRKEDDRRQKSGGGIFNFLKRGKVSNGSGSLSSDNRSISPTHSDDSRSVSPPVGGVKLTTPSEKPKPPQRKRRPAPKPPSLNNLNTAVDEKKNDDDGVGVQMRKKEGLTICHSRNSSDSSGYHEASILSDNANTSLPRKRPQTINTTSNLTAMKAQSKSTSSLAFTSRLKKKAAPPPPPAMKSAHSVAHLENASPVVASPTNEATIPDEDGKQHEALKHTNTPLARVETTGVTDAGDDPEEFTNFFCRRDVKNPAYKPPHQSDIPTQPEPQVPQVQRFDNAEDDSEDEIDYNSEKPLAEHKSRSMDSLNEEDYEIMFDKLLKKTKSGSIFDNLDKIDGHEDNIEDKDEDVDFSFSMLSENSGDSSDEEMLKMGPERHAPKRDLSFNSYSRLHGNTAPESDLQHFSKVPDFDLSELGGSNRIDKASSQNLWDSSSDRDYHSLSAMDENMESNEDKPKIVGVLMKKRKDSLKKYSSMGDISRYDKSTSSTREDLFTALYLCSNYPLTTSADVNVKKNEDTSPPESLASSLATTLSSNIETDIGNNIKDEITEEDDDSQLQTEETLKPPQVPTTTENLVNNEHSNKTKVEIVQSEPAPEIVIKSEEIVTEVITTPAPVILSDEVKPVEKLQIETAPEKINEFLEEKILENSKKDINLPSAMDNSDWEYQLPSPPTAFRDSSPQPDTTTSEESETLSDIHPSTDSILTSPELFEKLHVIKESQSQISESEVLSTKSGDSEEDKFISKLSLENLEIRKKLVYNRELATSLKYQDQDADEVASKRSSVMSELEDILKPSNTNGNEQSLVTPTTIEGNKNWNKVQAAVANFSSASRTDRALPNFKITTYDIPKKKINIFEDDSIRSNVTVPIPSTVGVTEEVVEDDKPSFERQPRQEYNKNRCLTLNRQFLQRSESFNSWTPNAPVKRSKSQVALKPEVPKKTFETITNEENKSRSTLDLTGLQSIEVMKAIRTTLTTTTPTNTTSNTTTTTDEVDTSASPVKPAIEIIKPLPPAKQATPRPLSMFATPSLNFASWKDRKPFGEIKTTPTPTPPAPAPKMNSVTNLNGTNNTNKVISNGTSNNLPKQVAHPVSTNNNVSIKVNGSEPISQQPTGNVLIKIGQPKQQDELTKRYINHSTAVGYRKPLGNINKVQNVRPHSIAIEKFEQFDASRVPIVRAVELKKHAHTNGTSVTQIRPDGDSNKVNIFENVVLRSAAGRKTTERPNSVNVTASSDDRGLLLESIRNFGGKKGLKTVKV
ncbi:uncharacterized protein [Atheta coriaria]